MTGLVLKLAPKERVLINGAVIENDIRRSRFSIITPSANVLRLKDAIHPEDANTPLSRACYHIQLVLAGSTAPKIAGPQIEAQLKELSAVFKGTFCQSNLSEANIAIKQEKFYSALKSLKLLLPIEQNLLARRFY